MSYEKQEWADYESGATPLSAARLNHMEDGILSAQRFWGWAETLPPQFVPSASDNRRFDQFAAYDFTGRAGEQVFVLGSIAGLTNGSVLTTEVAGTSNPGPYYDGTAGPGEGPALVFNPGAEKGVQNQILTSSGASGSDGSFSIIFVPPEGDYSVLLPREMNSNYTYFVGVVDGEFVVANGDNSRAFTAAPPTPGLPHLLTLYFAEYVYDEFGALIEGQSQVILDGTTIAGPGQLWLDDPEVDSVSPTIAISNVALAGDPVLFLWLAWWKLPFEETSPAYYLGAIHAYAREIGCPLPPEDDS